MSEWMCLECIERDLATLPPSQLWCAEVLERKPASLVETFLASARDVCPSFAFITFFLIGVLFFQNFPPRGVCVCFSFRFWRRSSARLLWIIEIFSSVVRTNKVCVIVFWDNWYLWVCKYFEMCGWASD